MFKRKRKSNDVRFIEKPTAFERFKGQEVDGKKIQGGCFPGIICIISTCPLLLPPKPPPQES